VEDGPREEAEGIAQRKGNRCPCAVFYSHDGFGLGHLSRTVYLAGRLRERNADVDVHIITSSPAAHRLVALHDFAWIKIPSVTKVGVERYRPHNLSSDLESVVALRSALILSAIQHIQPDVFVVDHRPLGLKGEALPTLQWLRDSMPQTSVVAGLRDVIDDPRAVRFDWSEHGIYDTLENLYDAVLVYGERSVLDITQVYAMPDSVRRKTRFVGYLGRGAAGQSREKVRRTLDLKDERLVVVHAGGGGDGTQLIATYLDGVHQLPEDVHSLVVAGPLMDAAERHRLRDSAKTPRITFVDCQEDLPSYVAAADLSISMGGYNTVCEVLSYGVPSIIVPRVFPRKEQHIRAQLLASRRLIRMVPPYSLTPRMLADAAIEVLETPPPLSLPLRLDGGDRAASYLASLLPQPAVTDHREYGRG